MYDILPKNEKNFDLKTKGETTSVSYEGRFKCKCILDISGKHSLELEKTRLMADYANPTNGLQGISLTIATLRAKLVEWPSWWDDSNYGLNILDENVILEIFDQVEDAEIKWRLDLREQADAARAAEQAKTPDVDASSEEEAPEGN